MNKEELLEIFNPEESNPHCSRCMAPEPKFDYAFDLRTEGEFTRVILPFCSEHCYITLCAAIRALGEASSLY